MIPPGDEEDAINAMADSFILVPLFLMAAPFVVIGIYDLLHLVFHVL